MKTCDCASTSISIDEYVSLQTEFEEFKNKFYVERMHLQTECSYLRDLFRKLNRNGLDIDEFFSLQKNAIDKTTLGYNK